LKAVVAIDNRARGSIYFPIYNIKDMMKTFNEIEPLGARHIAFHNEFINDYKQKKLAA